jgi:hypothetical protein
MSNEIAKPAGSRPVKAQTTTASRIPMRKEESNEAPKPNSLLKTSATLITPETRRMMVAEAAYYIAESRGFQSGGEVEDWLLAEKQIDSR